MTGNILSDKLCEKMDEYDKVFNDSIGTFETEGMEDEEIIALIDKCIKRGKPAEWEDYGFSEEDIKMLKSGRMVL